MLRIADLNWSFVFMARMIDRPLGGGNNTLEATELSNDAFFAAVRRGDVERVRALLDESPALVHARMDGATPLHYAAWENHRPMADLLLDRGADPQTRDERHEMLPIAWANEHGHMDMVRHLHGRGVTVPFQLAAAFGLVDVVRERLTEDSSVLDEARGYGTALHFAALWGQPEVVSLLLDAGANPDLPNANGEGALTVARRQTRSEARDTMLVIESRKAEIQRDCARVVEILTAHGAKS